MTIAMRSSGLEVAHIGPSDPPAAAPAQSQSTAAFKVRALPSVTGFAKSEWDNLFPGAVEGWDYFRACEQSAPEGFAMSAIGAYAGDKLVAAATLFRTDYRLDTPLQGVLRPLGDWLSRNVPRLTRMPVLGMGSPLTEECPIGMLPGMSPAERGDAFAALVQGMSDHAKASGISILALKDVMDRDTAWTDAPLKGMGFAKVASLPVATLHLPFKDEAGYLASLTHNMRKDMKKKMKGLANVQVEIRDTIDGVADEIVALFHETKAKSKADYDTFDEVPDAYFPEVVGALGGRAKLMLIRVGGELASFNIFLEEKDRIIGKYIGMRYPLAREHNVYFLNWMLMVRRCIENGAEWLQVGQTTYGQKVRLGCKLKRSWVYFKHRGALMGPLFRTFGPMMAFDAMDPSLVELGAEAPYLAAGEAA